MCVYMCVCVCVCVCVLCVCVSPGGGKVVRADARQSQWENW